MSFYLFIYCKVASSSMSPLVAHLMIFRRLLKWKFDAYVVWPLAKKFQSWIVDRSTALNFTVLSFLPYTKTKTKGLFLVLVVKIQNITTSCWMFRIIHIAFLPERHLYKSWKMIASAIVLLLIYLSLIAETFRQELLKPKYPRYPLLKKGYMLTEKF